MAKTHVNVVMCGNQGSGKSAVVAAIVPSIGKQCKCNSKILDTENREVTLIDTDGLPDQFDDNVAAISQVDAALVVVPATSEFETSLGDDVFRNRILIANRFGVKQLLVVVTKMDIAEGGAYNESRFNTIKEKVMEVINAAGFNQSYVPFIPVSTVNGDNLLEKSKENMPWFTGWSGTFSNVDVSGFTLVEALDKLEAPKRLPRMPLRLAIQKAFPRKDGNGTVATGVLDAGEIHLGQTITIAPGNTTAKLTYLRTPNDENRQSATAGEFVAFSVGKEVPPEKITRGCIIGNDDIMPPQGTQSFLSQLLVRNDVTMTEGTTMTIYCHTAAVQCKLVKILAEMPLKGSQTTDALVVFETLESASIGIMLPSSEPSTKLAQIVAKLDGKVIGMGTAWSTTAAL